MIDPRSLSFQSAVIREQLHKEPDDNKRAALELAAANLLKVKAASDPIKAVLEIFGVFPGAKLDRVTFYDDDRDAVE